MVSQSWCERAGRLPQRAGKRLSPTAETVHGGAERHHGQGSRAVPQPLPTPAPSRPTGRAQHHS